MLRNRDGTIAVSRRRYILTGGALLGGVGVMSLTADRTRAEVSMDTLSISDDSAELSQAPTEVLLSVGGSWTIDGPTPPEQTRVVLQVGHDGDDRDMDEHLEMNSPASGDYSLEADLMEHPAVDASSLMPSEIGTEKTTEFVVRIILLAIDGGSIVAESVVEDTAAVHLTKDGLELSVGGEGTVEVRV